MAPWVCSIRRIYAACSTMCGAEVIGKHGRLFHQAKHQAALLLLKAFLPEAAQSRQAQAGERKRTACNLEQRLLPTLWAHPALISRRLFARHRAVDPSVVPKHWKLQPAKCDPLRPALSSTLPRPGLNSRRGRSAVTRPSSLPSTPGVWPN